MAYHSAAIWARMPEDRTAQRATHGLADTNREAERQVMRAALEAAERAAWRPIAELAKEPMGEYLVETHPGYVVLWHKMAGVPYPATRYRRVLLPPAPDGEPSDV